MTYLKSILPNSQNILRTCKSIKEAKIDALVSVDTNILLYPYTVNTSSFEQIKSVYSKLVSQNRLYLVAHTLREFANNRNQKLGEIFTSVSNAHPSFKPLGKYPILESLDEYKELLKYEKTFEESFKVYKKYISNLTQKVKEISLNDPITEAYQSLFTQNEILECILNDEDIQKDFEYRVKHKIPPGYKDGKKEQNADGDLIIWHTLLELGKEKQKDLIFVTNDGKPDWFNQANGSSFLPRYELIDEYKRASGGKCIYIVHLSTFLELFGADEKIVQTIKQSEWLNKPKHGLAMSSFLKSYSQKIEEIKKWFFEHYDDPANLLPYESKEEGYLYIWGGPYDIEDVLMGQFYDEVPEGVIKEAIMDIVSEYGDIEWSKVPDPYLFLNIQVDRETGERCGAGGTFQVVSIEDHDDNDLTYLVDQGRHYLSFDELISDISKSIKISKSSIEWEEV